MGMRLGEGERGFHQCIFAQETPRAYERVTHSRTVCMENEQRKSINVHMYLLAARQQSPPSPADRAYHAYWSVFVFTDHNLHNLSHPIQ